MTGNERHANHAAAVGFDPVGADDLLARIVGALHEHVWRYRLDQCQGGVLIEQHDAVDGGKRGEDACSGGLVHDGTTAALGEPACADVAVEPDEQRRPFTPGRLE